MGMTGSSPRVTSLAVVIWFKRRAMGAGAFSPATGVPMVISLGGVEPSGAAISSIIPSLNSWRKGGKSPSGKMRSLCLTAGSWAWRLKMLVIEHSRIRNDFILWIFVCVCGGMLSQNKMAAMTDFLKFCEKNF